MVALGDYGRVIAEFWADGPSRRHRPGTGTRSPTSRRRLAARAAAIGGDGPEVDRLEYDVKMYLALNGAVHDAAIAAWGAKGHYDYVRPISMIRYMGGTGSRPTRTAASYDPDGLLLEDGLVEVITDASSAPGERTRRSPTTSARSRSGRGGRARRHRAEIGGVGWIRAVEWVPYQRATFVTPPFAGYVSGHSTFSRAAAEVLTD